MQLVAVRSQQGHAPDDLIDVGGEQVVRHHRVQAREPERAHLGEHRALVRDRFEHHDIERTDPVARHEQQCRVIDLVDLSHLPAPQQREWQLALN